MRGLTQDQVSKLRQALQDNGIEPAQHEDFVTCFQADVAARMRELSFETALEEALRQAPHRGYGRDQGRYFIGSKAWKQPFYSFLTSWPLWKVSVCLVLLGSLLVLFFKDGLPGIHKGYDSLLLVSIFVNSFLANWLLNKRSSSFANPLLKANILVPVAISVVGLLTGLIGFLLAFRVLWIVGMVIAMLPSFILLFMIPARILLNFQGDYIGARIISLFFVLWLSFFLKNGLDAESLSLYTDNAQVINVLGTLSVGMKTLLLLLNVEIFRVLKSLSTCAARFNKLAHQNESPVSRLAYSDETG